MRQNDGPGGPAHRDRQIAGDRADGATVFVKAPELESIVQSIFCASGLSRSAAAQWASALVWADLNGVSSHGVVRVPGYVESLAAGHINPRPELRLIGGAEAVTHIDADLAPGPIALAEGTRRALSSADRCGVGLCVVSNATHAGAVGYFAETIAEAGLLGIVAAVTPPVMAAPGGADPILGSNPVAIALPSRVGPSVMVDLSMANAAYGTIRSALAKGIEIPLGWGVDEAGAPTSKPELVHALVPMGGHKGAALSFVMECIMRGFFSDPIGARRVSRRSEAAVVAVRIGSLVSMEQFAARVEALAAAVCGGSEEGGSTTFRVPGSGRLAIRKERLKNGVPLDEAMLERLAQLSGRGSSH